MSQTYGQSLPDTHAQPPEQPPVRWVVLIDSAAEGRRVARLFLADRTEVAEMDASQPEVLSMTDALLADQGAEGPDWARALAGHTADERAAAQVFTLDA